MMMHRRFVVSMASLSLLFVFVLYVEAATLRHAKSRTDEIDGPNFSDRTSPAPSVGTTAKKVMHNPRLGVTSTTTATATSVTTTTTMMEYAGDMSPSDFYLVHQREHSLALAEEAAALEDNCHRDEVVKGEPRQPWRRQLRNVQQAKNLGRQQELPPEGKEDDDDASGQSAKEDQIGPVAEKMEGSKSKPSPSPSDGDGHEGDDDAASETNGAVADKAGGLASTQSSPPPLSDDDFDDEGHATDEVSSPPLSIRDTSAVGDIAGGDDRITIPSYCDVTRPDALGDGICDYDSEDDKGYNTAECGWDGGDCCYETCRAALCGAPSVELPGGSSGPGYVCRDPRFKNIEYDEEGEQDDQRRRERHALKALYKATNGDGWYGKRQWLNDALDHCYWSTARIRCTGGDGYVWRIDLNYNNLAGTLPTEIGQLVHLEVLLLNHNRRLEGTIPASIGNLRKLKQLNVAGTSLRGSVPANAMVPIFGTPLSYSADYMNYFTELSPHNCVDMVGWEDANGNGCEWFSENTSACATGGTLNMGHSACCACVWPEYDREGEVLDELFATTHGRGWYKSSHWTDRNITHCDWMGVQCNYDGMVTHLALPTNNLRGILPTVIGELRSLETLDVSNNVITGSIPTNIGSLRSLQILDVSDNGIVGSIPTETQNLTKLKRLHLHNNSLSGTIPTQIVSLSFLRQVDLSHNNLSGPLPVGTAIGDLVLLEDIRLTYNNLTGTIPVNFADLLFVEDLRVSHNQLTGTIPSKLGRMRSLKRLHLDNNHLNGSIPMDIGLLNLLKELKISNNALRASIPTELGDCKYLEVLDLSENELTGILPTELGMLAHMKNLLLRMNKFEGHIPQEYGLFPRLEIIALDTWPETKKKPAPLSLCSNKLFDLFSDPLWCPPERNTLKRLYDMTGGDMWSNKARWIDPYNDYCSWYGVNCTVRKSCQDVPNWTDYKGDGCDWYAKRSDYCKKYGDNYDEHNNGATHKNYTASRACCVCQQEKFGCFWNGTECTVVTNLSLVSNGLFGPLPAELFNLGELEELRLGNNRLYGALPEFVGRKIKVLQLSGNALSGKIPSSITSLTDLSLLHLHGNRFTTGVPDGISAFNITSDCGDPYYYGKLPREKSSICCNSEQKCMRNEKRTLGLPAQTGLFTGCMVTFLILFFAIVASVNRFTDLPMPKRSAADYCGKASVYRFFLTKSVRGWILTFATLATQMGIFALFLSAANVNDEGNDWVYYMRCPPNQLWCEDSRTVDKWGWLLFCSLMVAFVGKDVISGILLVYTAGLRTNVFCFVSGFFISIVTGYTVWTSVQYNLAIATSNTALVQNAVIILFVTDVDERVFEIIDWLFPEWVVERTEKGRKLSTYIRTKSGSTSKQTGKTANAAEIVSVSCEQRDEQDETPLPRREDLHAFCTKQNETNEELRAQIRDLKAAFERQTKERTCKSMLITNVESKSEDK